MTVTWDEPANTGPAITGYGVQYCLTSEDCDNNADNDWTDASHSGTTREITITGLTAATSYDVQVQATNAEGTSGWSASGSGATGAPGLVIAPVSTQPAAADRITALGDLTIAAETDGGVDYVRDNYDTGWKDADGDYCNAREEVLKDEATALTAVSGGCASTGTWYSWYDDTDVTDTSSLDIDHMVPLAEAHRSGGWQWLETQRHSYANDLAHPAALTAVTASSNRSKGARDPADWKPTDESVHCAYAMDWVSVKAAWALSAQQTEYDAVIGMLDGCFTVAEGNTATYSIALATQPTGTITVTLTSSRSAVATVSPAMLTFTTGNWNSPQTVTVTGPEDDIYDHPEQGTTTISHATSGADYGNLDDTELHITKPDNDFRSIALSATSLSVNEDTVDDPGLTYTMALTSPPTADVKVDVTATGATVNKALLTFTGSNWSDPQTVTVTATDDEQYTGDRTVTISNDPRRGGYGAADTAVVSVSITEDDGRNPVIGATPTGLSIAENITGNVGSAFTATDLDGDTITWSVDATSASSFAISSTGQLSVKTPGLNYEDGANVSVTVTASDGTGRSDSLAVTVSVANVDEDGSVKLSTASPITGRTVTATLTDPDGSVLSTTWKWASSSDGSTWTDISGATSASYTPVAGDLGKYLRATASYTDVLGSGKTASGKTTSGVADNSAPEIGVIPTLAIAENQTGNVGSVFTATDADGDTITWSVSGTGGSSFAISSTGQLSVTTALNFEDGASVSITVTASDSAASDSEDVTVSVTNVDEAGSVSFGSTSPTVDTSLTATLTDVDGSVSGTTWKWASSSDWVSATSTGMWTDISGATSTAYTPVAGDVSKYLRATASYTDALGSGKTAAVVTASAVVAAAANSAPTFPVSETGARSVAENTVAAQNIGAAVSATDVDNDSLTYTLGGTDAGSFSVVSISGQLLTKNALDYEVDASYTVTVTATDPSDATDIITVTISVTNVDEAGSVSLSSTSPMVDTVFPLDDVLAATLTDLDGSVSSTTWQWASSSDWDPTTDMGTWSDISVETSAAYILVVGDVGKYLRATASYTDALGSGKTAAGVTASAVALVTDIDSDPAFTYGVDTIYRSVAENTAGGRISATRSRPPTPTATF